MNDATEGGGGMTLVSLDGRGALYEQLYRALRDAIRDGLLAPGRRLPATRRLASDLEVSRNTVLGAYSLLRSEGYTVARVGSGTYVSSTLPEAYLLAGARRENGRGGSAPAPVRLSRHGRWVAELGGGRRRRDDPRFAGVLYDFSYGRLAYDDFPHAVWQRALSRASRETSAASLDYGDPAGEPPLREAVAEYLGRVRGVRCEPERIVVVNGSRQGLDLAARLLLDPGDAAVLEDPHFDEARRLLTAWGVRTLTVPVDDDGLRPERLPRDDDRVRLAYVTPSHQFPSGGVLPLERRLELLEWAEGEGVYIVEDDYDSEFRYEGRPVEAVQGLDRRGRVIYLGTFSKVMSPALRVGYLVLPERLAPAFREAKWLADCHTPRLVQRALAAFLAEGHFERHLRRVRTRNAGRRRALLEALDVHLGDRIEVAGSNAGVHLLLRVPDLPAAAVPGLLERAARRGVRVYSALHYYASPPDHAELLLGYASMTERQIEAATGRLAAAVRVAGEAALEEKVEPARRAGAR